MMAFSSLIVGVLLLVLLMAVALKDWLASRETLEPTGRDDDIGQQACPAELVRNIFSQDDWTYVQKMKSTSITKLFRSERREVARVWVRQTSSGIRRIMREHAAAARQSRNLESATELRIFLQFAVLLMTCRAIRAGIYVAGPLWVGGLAHYAQDLFLEIAEAEQSLNLKLNSARSRS